MYILNYTTEKEKLITELHNTQFPYPEDFPGFSDFKRQVIEQLGENEVLDSGVFANADGVFYANSATCVYLGGNVDIKRI